MPSPLSVVKYKRVLGNSRVSCTFVALDVENPAGAMVQRLARGPFKAEIRVRFPLALPSSVSSFICPSISWQ